MSIPPRWHLGGLLTVVAAAGDTNGALAVVEERAARGYATPPHVHGREDETLFVIDGELEYVVDDVPGTVTAGTAVHLPRGLPHHFAVTSAEAHFLVIVTPGGFEQFFHDASPPATAARLPSAADHVHTDPLRMVEAAAALGTTVFRETGAALTAARTVATSDNRSEITHAYRALGSALAGPGPLPAQLDEVVDLLAKAVTERLTTDPVHARALILLGIVIERTGTANRWNAALLDVIHQDLGEATLLAFAYALAHFPDHAEAVRAAMDPTAVDPTAMDPTATDTGLPEPDWQRLVRCLRTFDSPDARNQIGRVWPSPTVWQLDAAERGLDETWRARLDLDTGTARELWESETVALLAYMGAKADHAVERTTGDA
jgi:quercetin dioxygenase-like cupin family protein